MAADRRSSRSVRTAVIAITAAFGAVLTLWAFLTPVLRAPDELPHLNSSIRVWEDRTWPAPSEQRLLDWIGKISIDRDADRIASNSADRPVVSDLEAAYPGDSTRTDQMTQHPPTYYIVAGAVLQAINYEQHRWDVAVMALRGLSVLFMLPIPALIFGSVRRLTESPRAGLVSAVAVFAVPQLFQIGSSISNDPMMISLSAGVVWLATRVMTGDGRLRVVVGLGVLLGAAILTKGTAFPLVPFVGAALLLTPASRRLLLRLPWAAIALGIAGLLGGWWWLRNLALYGALQPSGLSVSRPTVDWPEGEMIDVKILLDTFWNATTESFWASFGRLEFTMIAPLTDALTAAGLGIVLIWAFRRGALRRPAIALAVLPVTVLVMMFQRVLSTYIRTAYVYGVQGRYFFVAIVALITLAAIGGLAAVRTTRARRIVGTVVVAVAVGVQVYGLWVAYWGFYVTPQFEDDVTTDGLALWGLQAWGGAPMIAVVATTAAITTLVALALVLRTLAARGGTAAGRRVSSVDASI